MLKFSKPSDGFSLIEVLMAITISLTIIAAVYQLSFSQQQTYRRQDQTVENRQNLRAIMALITKNIQLAGYDPTGRANAGIVTSFAPPHDGFLIDYTSQHDIIAFTIDNDADSKIDSSNDADSTTESINNDQVAFRLNNNSLETYRAMGSSWEVLSSNVDALNFVFLDGGGVPTTSISNIRAVEISLLVRSSKLDNQYTETIIYTNKQNHTLCPLCSDDHYRRRLLSKTIRLRNIGIN